MIQFTCPCGKALHARDDYAGQTTRCPSCGREQPIPGEGVQTDDAPRAPGRPPAEGVRSRRDRPEGPDWEPRPRPPTTSGMAVASMILGVLSLFLCSVFTGLPAILLGALGLRDIGRSEGRKQGKGLAVGGLVTGGLSLLLAPLVFFLARPALSRAWESPTRARSQNNLKQMVLAMHGYDDAMQTFPPAAICDANGTPLLSWRVAILPYVEEANLYNQFKMDEAWDGPNNSQLLKKMPKIYALPGDTTAPPGYTYYQVFVGNGAAFDPPRAGHPLGMTPGARIGDFQDGLSNTLMVVEAATPVPWTKPDDLAYDPAGPPPVLGGHFSGGFTAAMGDGSTRWIPDTLSPQTLRALITRGAGDVPGPDF